MPICYNLELGAVQERSMIRRILASICMLAILALAAPAGATDYRHGYYRHHGHYGGHGHYRYHDGGAYFAGGLLLGGLLGYLAAPRAYAPPPPPRPVLGNCRIIYGTGYYYGRLAEFSGTGCYDAYGNLYAMPDSARFLRYLE
jgi:hypothetical protein